MSESIIKTFAFQVTNELKEVIHVFTVTGLGRDEKVCLRDARRQARNYFESLTLTRIDK